MCQRCTVTWTENCVSRSKGPKSCVGCWVHSCGYWCNANACIGSTVAALVLPHVGHVGGARYVLFSLGEVQQSSLPGAPAEKNRKHILADGGVDGILAALKQHKADVVVQQWGCRALYNLAVTGMARTACVLWMCYSGVVLADDKMKTAIIDLGAIDVAVAALTEHRKSAVVVEEAVGLVGVLSSSG